MHKSPMVAKHDNISLLQLKDNYSYKLTNVVVYYYKNVLNGVHLVNPYPAKQFWMGKGDPILLRVSV